MNHASRLVMICVLLSLQCAQENGELNRNNVLDPNGTNWQPPLLYKQRDTIVHANAVVNIHPHAVAGRPGSFIQMYYCDTGNAGLLDSTPLPVFTLSKPGGGFVPVVWYARDNYGVRASDSFSILFSRPPAVAGILIPSSWAGFNFATQYGQMQIWFNASDPDSIHDTLAYSFWFGKTAASLTSKYAGRSTSCTLDSITPGATYYYKLTVHDLLGDSASKSNSFPAPSTFIGTWQCDSIFYDDGGRGYWKLTLGSSGSFSFDRVESTNDSKSIYSTGTYSVGSGVFTFTQTSYRLGMYGTTAACNNRDFCTFTVSSTAIVLTESGINSTMFNVANGTVFRKI